MNIEEAKQKLQITDEEVKAIQDYMGFAHTSINLLSDLDAKAYCKLSKSGWLLAKNKEDFRKKIKIFVDMYSLMYKKSYNSKETNVIRGTSVTRALDLRGTNHQFLSTSRSLEISKRFCNYKNPALINISIKEDVPYVDAEEYRESGRTNEKEIIIAPFCKITENKFDGEFNKYEYYKVSIEKQELQEKPQEEIENLMEQLLEGYEQNVSDMKAYEKSEDTLNYWKEKLERTTQVEEKESVLRSLKEAEKEFNILHEKTLNYKKNLTSLLQGMCRQKEIEIDKAKKELQKESIPKLTQKIEGITSKTGKLNEGILTAYTQLQENERRYKQLAKEFGVDFEGFLDPKLEEEITNTTDLVNRVAEELQQVQIPEDNTVKQTDKQLEQYEGQIDRIHLSIEISEELKSVSGLYKEQANEILKRNIYLQMNTLMKNAKIEVLKQKKNRIQNQRRGLFDKITKKSTLRELQLKNIDLRMEWMSKTVSEEKGYYSIQDMLAEIYSFSQTELGGQYTPELKKLFTTMKEVYRDNNGNMLSLDEIQKLAKPKIEKHQKENLPAIPKKKFKFFGKTKDQINHLKFDNSYLQTEINNDTHSFGNRLKPQAKPIAITAFEEKLKDIKYNVGTKEGSAITLSKTKEETSELFK